MEMVGEGLVINAVRINCGRAPTMEISKLLYSVVNGVVEDYLLT